MIQAGLSSEIDEQPCQMIGDSIVPLPIKPGSTKKGSWLDMALIKLSTLSNQCQDRRIGSLRMLANEVHARKQERNAIRATVRWRFDKDHAISKPQRHYIKCYKALALKAVHSYISNLLVLTQL